MSDITPETSLDIPKTHPMVASMPQHLKDPKNYDKIRKAILDAGATKHSHGEMVDWAGCRECQWAEWNKKETMQRLGFTSGAVYLVWRKIHETIKDRFPLAKYNKE